VRIKGLREQSVVCDLCDRIIGYLPSGSLLSRSTVAPTEEQIAGVLLHVMNDYQARDETTSKAEFCGSQARAVLALLPGESREAVEAKARAEVIDWIADGDSSPSIKRSVRNAREHFGIEADRGN
jgi:hypothetical protein